MYTPDFSYLELFLVQKNEFYLDCLDKLNYNVGSYGNFYLRKDF